LHLTDRYYPLSGKITQKIKQKSGKPVSRKDWSASGSLADCPSNQTTPAKLNLTFNQARCKRLAFGK
jgi:hypothetical protein